MMEKHLDKFAWLDTELQQMGTRRFYLPGRCVPDSREVAKLRPALPPDYVEFVARYGDTALFRVSSLSYRLSIWWPPPRKFVHRGTSLLIVGMTEGAYIAFAEREAAATCDDKVRELSVNGACRSTGKTFAAWLQDRVAATKRKYGKRAWQQLQRGPDPFTEEELAVVEARGLFEWEVVEASVPSLPTFRIRNRSRMCLPFITLDYQANVPGLFLPNFHGGFFIPVANVRPGNEILVQKALTYHDRCEYVAPVVFSDPIYTEPQEREYLWEFRLMPQDDQ